MGQLDYESLNPRGRSNKAAKIALSLSFAALVMDCLFWQGVFASEETVGPLSALFVTAALTIASVVFSLISKGNRNAITTLGIFSSFASAGIGIGMIIYFFKHLPNC